MRSRCVLPHRSRDPGRRRHLRRRPRRGPDRVAVSENRVWFATSRRLTSIDAGTGQARTVDLPTEPNGIAGDRTGIWVTHPRESVVRRIEGDDIVRTVDVPQGWWDVALTEDGAVWVSGRDAILLLDPTTTGG